MRAVGPLGPRGELIAISLLILFTELACIRWFPAHVLFLTFFTNTVLLAAFLGMSAGALASQSKRNYFPSSAPTLAFTMTLAHVVDNLRLWLAPVLDVGGQASPQVVYFGAEYHAGDAASFVIPIEVVNAIFFLLIAMVFVGPGQELGRALARIPGRVEAYTYDILGSLTGIVLFAAVSYLMLPPLAWFGMVAPGFAYFLWVHHRPAFGTGLGWLVAVLFCASVTSGLADLFDDAVSTHWSPYYRIDYDKEKRGIITNLIGHQHMVGANNPASAYALPHALQPTCGGEAIRRGADHRSGLGK